ncbi:MAG: MFS transporter [Anaerolineales bacterium]|nr:MFS transporter [Anaerolineales bacterium]
MQQRRAIAIFAAGHAFTDLNQGALPALLPFFVASYHFTYAQAAGLTFAATIASSVVQPLFGSLADRVPAAWLIPAGVFGAGLGMSLLGLMPSYPMMLLVLIISGLGVAAFHPEAARGMHAASGRLKATSMSVFSMGGSAGFAVGPLLATALMEAFGTRGTIALLAPALFITLVILTQQRRWPKGALAQAHAHSHAPAAPAAGGELRTDDWRRFAILAAALMFRSIFFFGFNIFLPLYWVNVLGRSAAEGGVALSVYLGLGLVGVLAGGRLADRYGMRALMLWSNLLVCPFVLLFLAMGQLLPAVALLVVLGLVVAAPGSTLVVMGQNYLPNHVGVASGVTIGLSVSAGGAVAPLLGRLADTYGLQPALIGLGLLPILAAALIWRLPRESRAAPQPAAAEA